MGLNTKGFAVLVSDMAASIQGTAAALVDMSVGSILLAVTQANASLLLWLQSLLLRVLSVTRASTSAGADLDSWLADYGFARLPGVAATGQVLFARVTPTQPALVPVGTKVQSADGTLQYAVVADPANAGFDGAQGGYPLAAGVAGVWASVRAVAAGAAYNAQAGQVNTLASPVPGVDAVSNAMPFVTGADAELDAAVRVRFVLWMASLSKATRGAVAYAIAQVQVTASHLLVENRTYAGQPQPGFFYVVADDGTGAPSAAFLAAVTNAVEAVRPLSVAFAVYAPTVLTANFAATIAVAPGFDPTTTQAAVAAAVAGYIDALPLGAALPYSKLIQVAWQASPGVQNVSGARLNGATADLAGDPRQSIRVGAVVLG